MIYITSDQHWGHTNIITLSTWRRFEDVNHMNEHMITAWNERVQPDDVVYHLGDIFWHIDVARKIAPRLNGDIKLILGNHDWWWGERDDGEFEDRIEILPPIHRLNFNKTKIWLCHYPMRSWEGNFRGAMHVHGHTHGSLPDRLPRSMDMSVDVAGYQPWTVEEVWQTLDKDPVKPAELGLEYTDGKETS